MPKSILFSLLASIVVFVSISVSNIADAQTVGDDNAVPSTDLKIPGDVQLLGKRDSNVRKAMAIVNGYVITETDVDQRLRWLLLQNGQAGLPADQLQAARSQILDSLIDETLQIQAAEADDMLPKDKEVEEIYVRNAERIGHTPRQMDEALLKAGSSPQSFKRQIKGELAWQRVLQRRVGIFVNVSDDEVNATIDRIKSRKGSTERRVAEIWLRANSGEEEQVVANMAKIIEIIKQTGDFAGAAVKYSEATTAKNGGDLGWLGEDQLPDVWATQAREMETGQLAGPIPVPGGVSLIYMIDKRQVLVADPRDATLSLRQLAINFPAGASPDQAKTIAERFATETSKISGCGSVAPVAQRLGAEVVDNDQVVARNLPGPLLDLIMSLNVGQATQPFGTLEDGLRVLVLCGRDMPQQVAEPNFDQVKSRLEDQRVEQSGRRYLRDLRRDAVIDYR